MKIVIIGAGNVGTNLSIALSKNHNIVQILSKTGSSAELLAKKLKTNFTSEIKKVDIDADLYIISVSDSSIQDISNKLKLKNKLIVHTAGSIGIEVLSNTDNDFGVFYPLQTFSKNKLLDFNSIPMCIEANNLETENKLRDVALGISSKVYKITTSQRKHLHLAAIFACNFTNHLYDLSHNILKENNLNFEIIQPLIIETANKILGTHPALAQTGPAMRNDKIIIENHIELLSLNSNLQDIYKKLTNSIIEKHKENGKL